MRDGQGKEEGRDATLAKIAECRDKLAQEEEREEAERARKRREWEFTFGLVLPVLCLLFDPCVFKRWRALGTLPMLAAYGTTAYLFIGLQMGCFVLWSWRGRAMGGASAWFAGVMFSGVLAALSLGVALFPVSALGVLFLGLGLLGFTPFGTAWAFWQQVRRALMQAKASMRTGVVAVWFAVGVMCMALPFGAYQVQRAQTLNRSIAALMEGDTKESAAALQRLRAFLDSELTLLAVAYRREKDKVRRKRLERAYEKLTGSQLWRLID